MNNEENKSTLSKLLTTMNPFALAAGTLDANLPAIFVDPLKYPTVHKITWNSIGSVVSLGTISALATAVSHRLRKRKWDKKQKSIVESSVNSLYPVSIPNTVNNSVEEVEQARRIPAPIAKEATGSNKRPLGEVLVDTLAGSVPIAAGITAMALAPAYIHDKLKDVDEDNLDREIAMRYNRLDELHAEAIRLGLSKKANGLVKGFSACTDAIRGLTATLKDTAADAKDATASLVNSASTPVSASLATLLALAGPLAGKLLYDHLKKTDKNEKVVDTMEDLASENLTNIPQRISLRLSDRGTPVTSRKDQKALEKGEDKKDEKNKANSKAEQEKEPKKLENKETSKSTENETKTEKDDLFA